MTDAEIALIVQEARYGTDCPVSGDFDRAVKDAIFAGYRAGMRDVARSLEEVGLTKSAQAVDHWIAQYEAKARSVLPKSQVKL